MSEVIDVPEDVWRLVLTLTRTDGTRYRARRVVGRGVARNVIGTEAVAISNTAGAACHDIIARSSK